MFQKSSPPTSDLLRSLLSCNRPFGWLVLALGLLGSPTHRASAITTYTVLVMRTTLTDSVPVKSKATINDMFFTNTKGVAAFYKDQSYGQMTWSGTTIDVSINYSTTDGSSSGDWATAAEAQAKLQGYDPNNYNAKLTICDAKGGGNTTGLAGYAVVGGSGSTRVFIVSSGDMAASAHELGHVLALDHASTDLNNDGVIDAEYGDTGDDMGTGHYTFNAPHRLQRNWLAATAITANGTYTIAPAENSSGTRLFRYDLSGGGESYFFSYRQATGFDANTTWSDGDTKTPLGAPWTTGLGIHRFRGPGDTGHILQVAQPLTDGGSYTIPGTSVIIKQTGHNSSGATLTVSGISAGTGGFTGAGTYRLTPYAASGSALNVPGFATGNPDKVQTVIYTWDGGTNEKFNFVSLGGDIYKIQCAFNTAQVLDAAGTTDNSRVGVWTDTGGSNQQWQVVSTGDGYYNLVPQNATTKALDNYGGSTTNGNGQVLYAPTSNVNNFKWKFTKQ